MFREQGLIEKVSLVGKGVPVGVESPVYWVVDEVAQVPRVEVCKATESTGEVARGVVATKYGAELRVHQVFHVLSGIKKDERIISFKEQYFDVTICCEGPLA